MVSDRCYAAIVAANLDRQPGFAAWRTVAAAFAGALLVQPFPRLSAAVVEHPGWGLGQWYADAVGMHVFLETCKDRHLARVAAETGARLLAYAPGDADRLLTPAALMNPVDGVHQAEAYGDVVLDQLIAHCAEHQGS